MADAQGSIEYLIILSVVIVLIVVVSMIVINYFSSSPQDYYFALCRQAASTCKITISANPADPCVVCENACNDTSGAEIFTGAINCCRRGLPSEIYSDSPGC